MRFRLLNQKGNALIGAIAVMVVLAAAATTVVSISGADTKQVTNSMQKSQSEGLANAGIQYAVDKLYNGENPNTTDKVFAEGSFSVFTDPASNLVTVTARVGAAMSTQSINADYSKSCVDLIVSQAVVNGEVLENVQLVKSCNKKAILSKVYLTWDWSECALGVECDGSVSINDEIDNDDVVYDDCTPSKPWKFCICHVPPGAPENKQSLEVSIMGWVNGHSSGTGEMHNMDYLGPCVLSGSEGGDGVDEEEAIVTCEGTDQSEEAIAECEAAGEDATVNEIEMAGTIIFNAGSIPSAEAAAAASGTEIDVLDAVMEANGAYSIDITYSELIPAGAWVYITTEFADGSELSGIFKAGNEAAPLPPEEGEEEGGEEPPAEEGFEVENGIVIVDSDYKVDLEVIGSAITCGAGGPEVNVRAELCINNNCNQLWGYDDLDGGETHTTTNSVPESEYKVRANAYLSSCSGFNKTYVSTDTLQVKTLTNGQQAPPLAGYGGQQSIEEFLAGYLDENGNVVLNSDQVIMLFELGVNMSEDPDSTAADFQDLVVLMTISDVEE